MGVFIVGGAAITPFLSIFRSLKKEAELDGQMFILPIKTGADIIDRDAFNMLLGNNFINILSQEKKPGCDFGRVNEAYLKEKISGFGQCFYMCGPDEVVGSVQKNLQNLGAKTLS